MVAAGSLSERDFQAALQVHLAAVPGVRAFRQNAGTLLAGSGALKRAVKGAPAGASDLWVLAWPSVYVGVECKIHPRKPTVAQERWGAMLVNLGALYVVATACPQHSATEAAALWGMTVMNAIDEHRTLLGRLLTPTR